MGLLRTHLIPWLLKMWANPVGWRKVPVLFIDRKHHIFTFPFTTFCHLWASFFLFLRARRLPFNTEKLGSQVFSLFYPQIRGSKFNLSVNRKSRNPLAQGLMNMENATKPPIRSLEGQLWWCLLYVASRIHEAGWLDLVYWFFSLKYPD